MCVGLENLISTTFVLVSCMAHCVEYLEDVDTPNSIYDLISNHPPM